MTGITKTTWSQLDPGFRAELAAVVAGRGDTYVCQYKDAMAWWLLLMLVCVGGGGAALWDLLSEPAGLARWGSLFAENPFRALFGFVRSPQRLGLLAAAVVGVWTAVTWVRNHGRRGLALTKDAVVVVRGRHLRVLPYAEIADVQRTSHGNYGRSKQRFTVLALTTKQGAKLKLYTFGHWANAAQQRIAAA